MNICITILAVISLLCSVTSSPLEKVEVTKGSSSGALNINLRTLGQEHNLKLQKPDTHILSPNFKLLIADIDENGKPVFKDATPSKTALNSLQNNIKIDKQFNAVLTVLEDGENVKLNGLIDSFAISSDANNHYVAPHSANLKLDYIDLKRNLTPRANIHGESTEATAVVELFLVIDYVKFQLTFGGDSDALAEYLAVFFHAVNNRYATENDPGVSFLVSGAAAFASREAQNFIEAGKIPNSNSYDSGIVLDGFGEWLYQRLELSPRYDLGVLITEEDMNGVGGLAWMNAACWIADGKVLASSLNVDQGRGWRGVFVVAHEIGHNLGAPHDGDDGDGRDCPGEDGYLMGDTSKPNHNKYYMSECTKRTINRFLDTGNSDCLRSLQGEGHWGPGNDDPGHKMDMTEQCKIWTKIDSASVVPDRDPNELCKNLICWWPDESGDFNWVQTMNLPPGDNSPCGNGGRCWLGNCV